MNKVDVWGKAAAILCNEQNFIAMAVVSKVWITDDFVYIVKYDDNTAVQGVSWQLRAAELCKLVTMSKTRQSFQQNINFWSSSSAS